MSTYTHRLVIIVPLANLSQANQTAAHWDPAGGGSKAFGSVRLSESGQEPATHTACDTLAEDDLYNGVPSLSGLFSAAYDVMTGQKILGGGSAWVNYNCADWSGRQCFSDMGLSVIESVAP